MTCDEARLFIEAQPESVSPELQAHLSLCPECQAHRERMLAFNARIRRALELDVGQPRLVPEARRPATTRSSDDNVVVIPRRTEAPAPRATRPRRLAFAASLAAGMLIAFTLWLSRPTQTLAAEIVTHVEGEPASWSQTEPVAAERLRQVLRKSGVRFANAAPPVVYASACWFRGHYVPHFVVMTRSGPVTVMILVHEHVTASEHFNEGGYSGLLVPAPTGAVAVLSRSPMALEDPANDVIRALQGSASTPSPSRL